MFDIGFSEMLVIAVVALLVLGPERLPRVARTVGHLLGRAQRYVSQVKSDIHREMHLADLKKMQDEFEASTRAVEESVRAQVKTVQASVQLEMPLPAPEDEQNIPTSPERNQPASVQSPPALSRIQP